MMRASVYYRAVRHSRLVLLAPLLVSLPLSACLDAQPTPPPSIAGAQLIEDFSDGKLVRGGALGFNDDAGVRPVVAVVPAAGLGFPAGITNVLRVEHVRGARPGWVARTGMRPIETGESILYRFYLLNGLTRPKSLNNHHPVETAAGGGGLPPGSNMELKFDAEGSTFTLALVLGSHAWTPFANGRPVALDRTKVYRVEVRLLKTGANTFTPFFRIYDAAGKLLYRDEDMGCTINWSDRMVKDGPGSSLTEANARNIRFGINGGSDLGGGQYHYFGGIAVAIRRSPANDVIGPHTRGEAH